MIAVTSSSFSKSSTLTAELRNHFTEVRLNISGEKLQGDDLARFLTDADGAVIGLERIDRDVLCQCSNLKFIAKYGVGLDNIDLKACNEMGVKVGWTGGVNRLSVAEMTVGFMLALCRNLFFSSNQLKGGEWNKTGGAQLSGKTIGIIGVGNIGQEVIRLLQPFGCQIMVNDIIDNPGFYERYGLEFATKEEIFAHADIVSIHTPLTEETCHLINRATLQRMKRSAFLINTARGGIVLHEDLKWALKNGIIAGAAIDVYESEPPEDSDLLGIPNLICTPHIGGNANEAVIAMGMSAIKHLREFFRV